MSQSTIKMEKGYYTKGQRGTFVEKRSQSTIKMEKGYYCQLLGKSQSTIKMEKGYYLVYRTMYG